MYPGCRAESPRASGVGDPKLSLIDDGDITDRVSDVVC